MSQILQKSPFSPELLQHNEAQLDFILEMYASEHPKEMQFIRPGKPGPEQAPVTMRDWANVLRGKALAEFMAPLMPNAKVMEALRARHNASVVRPVVKRRQPDANN